MRRHGEPFSPAGKGGSPTITDCQPGAGTTLPDRLALFRHQVALAARLLGVAVEIQNRVVAAVDQLPASSVRPDIGRQAQEWAAQHRTPRIYEK